MRLATNINAITDVTAVALPLRVKLAWTRFWPVVAFVMVLLPMPTRLEVAFTGPLQAVGTSGSTYLLQTLGYPAVAEGAVIVVHDTRFAVAETFSGLRMLVPFVAVSSAVTLCVSRPLWERCLVVASGVPVAIVCNVARVTGMVLFAQSVRSEVAHKWFHNASGWLMLPLAVGLLFGELWILSRLLIAPPERDVVPVGSCRRANA